MTLDLRRDLKERRFVELDPNLAKHYLQYNTHKRQRKLRPNHVQYLAHKMKTGLFRFGEISFAEFGGHDILVNGQHICNAAILSKCTVPCVFEKYHTETKVDVSTLLRQFDPLVHSLKDLVHIEAYALDLKWPDYVSELIVGAAAIDIANQKRFGGALGTSTTIKGNQVLSKDDKIGLLRNYLAEGAFINNILTYNSTKADRKPVAHIAKVPIIVSLIRTWRSDTNDAEIFWTHVRDGELLTKDMPEMKLREFLVDIKSARRRNVATKSVSSHEYIYRTILAWNAFRKGKPTNLAYFPNKAVPKID